MIVERPVMMLAKRLQSSTPKWKWGEKPKLNRKLRW
jgi:hypothetical protein